MAELTTDHLAWTPPPPSRSGSFKTPFGLAFRDIDCALGLVPAISLEFGFISRMNFGREPFRFAPPTSQVLPVETAVQERLAKRVKESAGKHAGQWWPTTGEMVRWSHCKSLRRRAICDLGLCITMHRTSTRTSSSIICASQTKQTSPTHARASNTLASFSHMASGTSK